MHRLCELQPDICLTIDENAWKNLSQGSPRTPVGTMKTEYTEQSTHNNISNNEPHHKASHPTRPQSSDTPLCQLQIPQIFSSLSI
jgi:hypothetical protein